MTSVEIGVLGPSLLRVGGRRVHLTGHQRVLLAGLVLHGGGGASHGGGGARVDDLIGALWSLGSPPSAKASLHNHLSRLRRLLPDGTLSLDRATYRLAPGVAIDATSFVAAADVATAAAAGRDHAAALRASVAALEQWRGEPFEDLGVDLPQADAARLQLHERCAQVEEVRARALLGLGRTGEAVIVLRELVAAAPHREQRWLDLMEAMERSGRRADALELYLDAHRHFVDELGIDPPVELQRRQQRVLATEPPPVGSWHGQVLPRTGIVDAVEAAAAETRCVVVTGEAGIGKSTVIDQLARRLVDAGRTVATVTCLATPWSAMQPVLDVLARLRHELDQLDPPPPPSVQQLRRRNDPTITTVPVTADAAAGRLPEDLASTLARVADLTGGVTVVVDEAHRAGPTTHELLLDAVRRSPRLTLVASTRSPLELPKTLRDAAAEVPVEPLAEEEIATLVAGVAPPAADTTAVVAWLGRLTGGNPLFVTAILDDLRRHGGLATDGDGRVVAPRDLPVPATLPAVVDDLLGRLPPTAVRAVEIAAVLGDPVDATVFEALADPDELDAAVGAGLLVVESGGRWSFRHELVQRCTYERIPTARRQELHLAVAGVLRRHGADAPMVAGHALAAADLDPLGAVAAARDAGTEAATTMAFAEAARFYDAAAHLLGVSGTARDRDVLALRADAADARRLGGLPGSADELLTVAEATLELDDDPLRTRAVLAALQLGETSEAGPLQQRAAKLARAVLEREHRRPTRAAICASASMVHSISGEPERCRELFLEARSLLDDGDPATACQVLPYAYMALCHVDDLDARADAASRLRAAAEVTGDPIGAFEGWHLTFSVALQQADGTLLRTAHDAMGALLGEVGDAGRRWQHRYQQAALAALDGELDHAEALAGHAYEIGATVAQSRAFNAYAGQLVELRRLAGRLDELAPLVHQLADEQTVLPAWKAVASCVVATAEPELSRRLHDEVAGAGFVALPRDFTWLGALAMLGRAAVRRGDRDRARAVAAVLRPYEGLIVWQGTCSYGPVALVLAETALLDDDVEEATRLVTIARTRVSRLAAPAYDREIGQLQAGLDRALVKD